LLLKDEIKLNTDLNHEDNLICLCRDCHTKFDKPRTIEEYKNMVNLKKNIISKTSEKNNWFNNNIEKELIEIITILSDNEEILNDINII